MRCKLAVGLIVLSTSNLIRTVQKRSEMFDFTELSENGEQLEQLVRELCLSLGYRFRWTGRGADAGQDLVLEEEGDALFGKKIRSWLVSCKHTAHANYGKGRAVNGGDVGSDGGIIDAVAQHNAHGYLLVCSTVPSSALVTRLDAIERNRGISTHIWDCVDLERMLYTPRGWLTAQRFMPESTNASSWKVFATDSPNKFIAITRGCYIRITNRHEGRMNVSLTALQERLEAALSITFPEGQALRPRAVFHDDKNSILHWYFDYLYSRTVDEEELLDDEELRARLADFKMIDSDWDSVHDEFNINHRIIRMSGDQYHPDHHWFYEDLPSYL